MAMTNTIHSPKFKRLRARLGLGVAHTLGYLECLWQYTHGTGNPIYEPRDIEPAAEWDGETDVLLDALLAENWLDLLEDGNVQIHNYWDNAPQFVKDRERKRAAVSKKSTNQSCTFQEFPRISKKVHELSDKNRIRIEENKNRIEEEQNIETAPVGADERVFLLSEKCAAERMLADTPEQFMIDRLSLQSKVEDCEEKLRALDCGAVDLFESASTPTQDIKPVKDAALAEYLQALPLAWNDMAAQHGLTKVFVDKHGKAILEGSRLKAAVKAWKSSAVYRENWRIAIQGVSKSPFHLGQNDRKWRADLDFFLRIPKDGPPKYMQFLELARTAEDRENEKPF